MIGARGWTSCGLVLSPFSAWHARRVQQMRHAAFCFSSRVFFHAHTCAPAGMSLEDLGHEVEYRTDARGHVVPRASTGIGLSSHKLYLISLIQCFSPVPYLPYLYILFPLSRKSRLRCNGKSKRVVYRCPLSPRMVGLAFVASTLLIL